MSPRRPTAPSGGPRPSSGPAGSAGPTRPGSVPRSGASKQVSTPKPPPAVGQPGARPKSTGRTVRPVARPGGSRGPRPGTAGRSAAPRPGIAAGTRRPVWVVGAVAVILVALILPYFQKWLVQRSQIEEARASLATSSQQVEKLNGELAQWQDEQYVKAQARERLHYVMPGETGYVVVAPDEKVPARSPDQQAADVPTGNRPWYSDMWLSAQVAGGED